MKRIDLTNSPSRRGHSSAFTLAKGATHVTHCNNLRKAAFTLAEVLITLGIIGVVAAMTLPTLIQQHQKQVYATGAKKGFSTVQNMVNKMMADEGVSDVSQISLFDGMCAQGKENCEDSYGNISGLDSIIPKYIKTVKSCSDSECDIKYHDAWFHNGKYTGFSSSYKISEGGALSATRGGIKGYYSNDGIVYYFGFDGRMDYHSSTDSYTLDSNSVGLVTCIDVNGEKGPNTRGRDLFCYSYCPNLGGKLLPGKQHICIDPDWSETQIENRLMTNSWKMDY